MHSNMRPAPQKEDVFEYSRPLMDVCKNLPVIKNTDWQRETRDVSCIGPLSTENGLTELYKICSMANRRLDIIHYI